MGSMPTGELFTQDEYNAMTPERREELQLVPVTPEQAKVLTELPKEERKRLLKLQHARSRRVLNKRERQNKRKARAGRR